MKIDITTIIDNDIYFKNGYRAIYDIESKTGYYLLDDFGEYLAKNGDKFNYAWNLEEIFIYIDKKED